MRIGSWQGFPSVRVSVAFAAPEVKSEAGMPITQRLQQNCSIRLGLRRGGGIFPRRQIGPLPKKHHVTNVQTSHS